MYISRIRLCLHYAIILQSYEKKTRYGNASALIFQVRVFTDIPVTYGTLTTVMVDSYLHQSFTVGRIGYQVTLVANLLEGIFGGVVVLQFEDVHSVLHMGNC